jgi:hypothetical protein
MAWKGYEMSALGHKQTFAAHHRCPLYPRSSPCCAMRDEGRRKSFWKPMHRISDAAPLWIWTFCSRVSDQWTCRHSHLRQQCPLLALSGHRKCAHVCPLLDQSGQRTQRKFRFTERGMPNWPC